MSAPHADDRERRLAMSWHANADAWTDAVRSGSIASRRMATDEAIRNAVIATGARRILDAGCGEGWLARELSTQGCEVVGIDGSAPLIAHAQALGGATFHVLAYESLMSNSDRLGAPFDAIVCNFSLLGESLTPLLTALQSLLTAEGALVIQTVHPFTAGGEQPYRDGWRAETFDAFGQQFHEAMPWYFRTVASWFTAIREAALYVDDCAEPAHPETGRPLSLLLTCRSTLAGSSSR